MKIIGLIENNCYEKDVNLNCEHGLSLLIENKNKKILFDSGQTNEVINNASRMKVDLSSIDCFVLSHSHYDHTGGILEISKIQKSKKKLIIGHNFFEDKYKYVGKNIYKYIGVPFDKQELINEYDVRIPDENIYSIDENIYVVQNFDYKFEKQNKYLMKKVDDKYIIDDFEEELVIVIDTDEGLVVISGCAHVGIVNILSTVKKRFKKNIFAFIGGTHLTNEDILRIKFTIDYFLYEDIKIIAPIHCTGSKAEKIMKAELKDRFIEFGSGSTIEINYE